ncbi:unnamed protein product [Bursaphelenchus okinawaensis]|uniref:Uncharacterized protein n=1 Tax=Bursaphelenchus okinawaensis TaxID=465554 RepID=A0A811L428_9BILA|nr:unnamed protein product [Bursaphelenchus okinawaensis]CAG9119065.1 unnamed protein product [Bursaphelenchus okinawaensis]
MSEKGLIATVRGYPRAVFYSLGNEFCERFSYFGMRAILVIYLLYEHNMTASKAFFVYHMFIALSYLSSLLGSVAADNYFGRFKVIIWGSIVYVLGHVCLSFGAVPNLEHSVRSLFDFGGLFVIALATGSIKPCVSAFAADQFEDRPDAEKDRERFFSFWYFAINAGSLLGMILTPILRGRVSCLGSDYCYPLAFGVPGVFMLFAFLIFLSGVRHYRRVPADKGNVIGQVVKCIGYAAAEKVKHTATGRDKREHWLDYADGKFSHSLIAGVKSLLGVIVMYIPVVLYSALNDQMGSTWQEQSIKLNGRVGPFTILPDQLKILNPLLILFMVPIFEAYIYPCIRKFTPITPLRKMAAGGILTAAAFVLAGFVELSLQPSLEPTPIDGHAFVQRFGNASADLRTLTGLPLQTGKNEWPAGDYIVPNNDGTNMNVTVQPGDSIVLGVYEINRSIKSFVFPYSTKKPENLRTRLFLIVPPGSGLVGQPLFIYNENGKLDQEVQIEAGKKVDLQPGSVSSPRYRLKYGSGCSLNSLNCPYERDFTADMGAVVVLDLSDITSNGEQTIVRPNTVNILWQIPQYVIISAGEILFGIAGLEFSYAEAAPNMKSVLQAAWLMTTFFGNLIDAGISGSKLVADPAAEFFLYASMMFGVMIIFIIMAIRYKSVDRNEFDALPAEKPEIDD